MNVELTIQAMFDYYPTLYKERADCLNQLFLTVGNGYKWENGELVERCGSYPPFDDLEDLISHLVNGKAFQHNKMSLRAEAIYYDQERRNDPNYIDPLSRYYPPDKVKQMHEDYLNKLPDDVYYDEPNRRYRWYCCRKMKDGTEWIDWCEKYIALLNVPENIQPDWLAAIEETKQLLAEDGLVTY